MIKSVLLRAASFAVMLHMAFGCSWHHGFSAANACNDTCMSSDCQTGVKPKPSHDCCHDHEDLEDSENEPKASDPCNQKEHNEPDSPGNHLCCCDDGCNAIPTVEFAFASIDFSTACPGGSGFTAIVGASPNSSLLVDPFPDSAYLTLKLRMHLAIGVQLI